MCAVDGQKEDKKLLNSDYVRLRLVSVPVGRLLCVSTKILDAIHLCITTRA